MNLKELRVRVANIIAFNKDAPDQDFTGDSDDVWSRIDGALNEALFDEWNQAVLEAGSTRFLTTSTDTWSTGNITYTLPSELQQGDIFAIYDVTNTARGVPLWMGQRQQGATLAWRDFRTLEWGVAGPGYDVSLLLQHVARPVKMLTANDSPTFMPEEYHHLIAWSAAVILRDEADERAPDGWLRRIDRIRTAFHKAMSKRQPVVTGPAFTNASQDDWL